MGAKQASRSGSHKFQFKNTREIILQEKQAHSLVTQIQVHEKPQR